MNQEQINQNTINYFKAVQQYVEKLGDVKATVGVHSDKGENVKKAIWNEFGTHHILKYDSIPVENQGLLPLSSATYQSLSYENVIANKSADISIPARPFVRLYLYPASVLKIEREFQKNFDTMIRFHKRLNNSMHAASSTLDNVGRVAKEEMKNKIKNGNTYKPNSAITKMIKGFDHPLYNTGEMLNAIDNKVERRGA